MMNMQALYRMNLLENKKLLENNAILSDKVEAKKMELDMQNAKMGNLKQENDKLLGQIKNLYEDIQSLHQKLKENTR